MAPERKVEPRTAAAVIADDDGWSKAEETGDVAYIDALLHPEYRSIDADGKVHDKRAIIDNAKRNAGSTQRAAAIQEWRRTHPIRKSVTIAGDTAILTFTLNRAGEPNPVLSSDIFVYESGHWRALYSQHSNAGK